MINQVYQLVTPKQISVKYEDLTPGGGVLVRPEYMAICHADQRYFQGKRDAKTLRNKLPMALIHECCARVIYDPSGAWASGRRVALIPNVATAPDSVIYENYRRGSYFLSSGRDGFMRELVELPAAQMVALDGITPQAGAITEFVSVAAHALNRFDRAAHKIRGRIGIWGDGSLGYVTAGALRRQFPDARLIVVGHSRRKLSQFAFADETYLADELPDDLSVDHAFECCGGEGSYAAIEDAVRCIEPQGTLMLMGVSENRVAVYTRMVLEKGLMLLGCSRSGREDFLRAVEWMKDPVFQRRLSAVIWETAPVRTMEDIYRVFTEDMTTPFKTVFKWEL